MHAGCSSDYKVIKAIGLAILKIIWERYVLQAGAETGGQNVDGARTDSGELTLKNNLALELNGRPLSANEVVSWSSGIRQIGNREAV
jgi:hypothetical protein